MLGLVFKTSVGHFVSQVGSTPTSFRQVSIRDTFQDLILHCACPLG